MGMILESYSAQHSRSPDSRPPLSFRTGQKKTSGKRTANVDFGEEKFHGVIAMLTSNQRTFPGGSW